MRRARTTAYISMIRGINVGGKVVPMEQLRACCELPGFSKVRTYIQSGNVVFEGRSADAATIANKLQREIKKRLGVDVQVIVRTRGEILSVVENLPFKGLDPSKVHVPSCPRSPRTFRLKK